MFFLLNNVQAQDTIVIKEIIVEGNALQNAIELQKEAIPSKIVISKKDISNFGNHTAGDVLKRMPRIFVQGPPSFNRNIMIAGLDKQFQSVLVDGNRPAGGEDYRDLKLDRIPVDMIDEIEIIYNPSVEYGGDAAAGVINIKLKETPEKRSYSANIAMANTSTHTGVNPEFNASYGDKLKKISFVTAYSYNRFNRENYNAITNGKISGSEDENIKVHIQGFTGTINYLISDRSILKYKYFFSDYAEDQSLLANIKLRTQGGLSLTADTSTNNIVRRLQSHLLQLSTSGNHWKWTNTVSYGQNYDSKIREQNQLKSIGSEVTLENEIQHNNEAILNSAFTCFLKKHRIKTGLRASDFRRIYNRLTYTKPGGAMFWSEVVDGSYDLWENRFGGYVADEFCIGNLEAEPALRLDYDTRRYETTSDKGNYEYISLNPSLHIKYSAAKDLFLKADLARQISRPPFNQQVPVDKIKNKKETIERGNKNLKPARLQTISLGTEKYFGNNSYLTVRGFYSIMRDLIESRQVGFDDKTIGGTGYRIIQAINVDSGLVYGADVDAHIEFLKSVTNKLSLNSNFSYLGSEVRDATSGNMRRLNEQPRWITNNSVDYFNSILKLQMNYIDKRFLAGGTDEGTLVNTLVYEPYMQWDARIKYFFKPYASIYLNACNIFDQHLKISQGDVRESETVGRDIRVGISMIF